MVGGIGEEATEDEICLVQLDLQPVDLVRAAVQLLQLVLHPGVQLLPTGMARPIRTHVSQGEWTNRNRGPAACINQNSRLRGMDQ
jgi:hypothetical protein